MEELSLDNILGAEEIDTLFSDSEESQESPPENEEKASKDDAKNTEENDTTEVINSDTLFEEEPESVGSEETKEEKEDTVQSNSSTSPKNFYSSIAEALKEDGIFPDLDSETLSNVKTPEDFRDLIEQQIKAEFDERQNRIDAALNAGVEPDEIKLYENTLSYLNSLNDESISDESEKGETLRKNLIYQDFINRGYSKERASREVQKSLNAGTDLEDAKESLKSNLEYFKNKYDEIVNNAQQEIEQEEQNRKEQAEKLKTSILNDTSVFGDLSIDKKTRQQIYDNISKPVYKDPKTGNYYTAIQKYEMENSTEFLKNVGLLFTLTNGFKNLDSLVKTKVRKEVKKGIRELENTLNNTSRSSDGNLRYINGFQEEESSSFLDKGWKLDI